MSDEHKTHGRSDGEKEEKDREAGNKNADKKARVFDFEAMFARTQKTAQMRSAEVHQREEEGQDQEEKRKTSGPRGRDGAPAKSTHASTAASADSAIASEVSDDDDFMPALPPGFKPDTSVIAPGKEQQGKEEDDDSDYEGYEGEGIPIVQLIPTSCEATLKHGSKPVSVGKFEPNGQRFASGGLDYIVKLYDFQKMDMSLRADKEISPSECHVINSVVFSPNGENMIVASGDAQIRIFDRTTKQWAETNKGDQYLVDVSNTKGHTAAVNCIAWNSFTKDEFMSCSDDGTIRLWSLDDFKELTEAINTHRKVIKVKTANGKRAQPQVCCFSPDGKMIATGCDDGSIQAWKYGKVYVNVNYLVRKAHNGPITCVCFSPDSQKILSRGLDDTMKMWSIKDNKKPLLELTGLENGWKSTDCGFSPRGELVYTGTSSPNADTPGQLLFYTTEKFELVYKIDYPGVSVLRIDWHARLNQILTTLSDGTIKIYYDQQMSNRGVMACITKPVKRSRAQEVVREDMILSPLALEMFQPRGEEGEEKEVTAWRLKKYLRMRDNQLRPEFRKPADIPMDGPSANGRVAAAGSTLHSYLAKQIGTQRNKEFLEDTDVRTSILRHADDAAANPMYIDKAYKKNQPKPIFQAKTTAPEEEEEDKELQPLFKMPRMG